MSLSARRNYPFLVPVYRHTFIQIDISLFTPPGRGTRYACGRKEECSSSLSKRTERRRHEKKLFPMASFFRKEDSSRWKRKEHEKDSERCIVYARKGSFLKKEVASRVFSRAQGSFVPLRDKRLSKTLQTRSHAARQTDGPRHANR